MTAGGRLVVLGLALVAGLGACASHGGAAATTRTTRDLTRLERAEQGNYGDEGQYVEIADEGHTLLIDGEGGFNSPGASQSTTMSVLLALDLPTATYQRMLSTRALDGMQEDNWDEFTASWTYHPDDGLDIIIEEAE